ncbi:serine hydrolase domain-containing protein [Streptomyces sp. NPDC050418]|uniref:serine hydrolase domain-containing protein n=1 Tax=Streptomyces sp. NPDC050418 TaxID=3365612 RepID=UPI0037AB8FAA
MTDAAQVVGEVAAGFEAVREEFAAVVAREPADTGAQLVVYRDGRRVVDLWAATGVGETGDELAPLYSVTKGAAYLVVALLVQDGVLDLDREVAYYWPEFADQGKGALTLRGLLQHRAGVVGIPGGASPEELADEQEIAARLAAQVPLWQPGTAYGYHALVIGALVGEVVRRATGRSLQEIYEERLRAPHHLDFFMGLPEKEAARTRDMLPMRPTPEQAALLAESVPSQAMRVSFDIDGIPELSVYGNSPAVRAKGPASAGGVGSARGIAGLYAAALTGLDGADAFLMPETVALFTGPGTSTVGADVVTGEVGHFLVGFEAQQVRYPYLGADAFGHCGAAGAEVWADPSTGLTYAYTRRLWAFPGGAAPENLRLGEVVVGAAEAVAAG